MVERKYHFMIEYVHKIIEYIIFSLYLVFIFLSIQIWFVWKDINKNDLKFKHFADESFFRINSIYVFSFCSLLIMREIELFKVTYFDLFNLLAIISVVLFTYSWYSTLKPHAKEKIIPQELR